MQREHALVQRAMDTVANAAEKAGKWWGTVTNTPEQAQTEMDRGARMVTCANDHFLLVHGLQSASKSFANLTVPQRTAMNT
jgi:2-keto-3-deoxy-L-rhamnonate aldolase RhmA